jgi:hypothetical protein
LSDTVRTVQPLTTGFSSLPDAERTETASNQDQQFVWVDAEYNVLEAKSLAEAADQASRLMRQDKTGFKQIARESVWLNNRAAIRLRAEYDSPKGRVIREETITLRGGILYEIGLVTTPKDYASDYARYRQVLDGFRFWRIHYC